MLLAHVAARDDLERGEQFVAEEILPAADAGERRGRADHRPVADLRAVVRLDAPDRRDDMTVDAVGLLHPVERRAVLGEDGAAIGDARVGDQDVEILPGRLAELGLRVEQVHDPQVGRDAGHELVEHLARNVALLRQRPDAFEAGAEIRRRRPDRGSAHQRMTGGAVFAGPFARRLVWRRRRLAAAPGGVGVAVFGEENNERRSNPAQPPARRPRTAPPQPGQAVSVTSSFSPSAQLPPAHRNHCPVSRVIWASSHNVTIQNSIHAPLTSSGVEAATS